MLARYFQGSTVTGPVKASAARTFREVVDALRICPTLRIAHGDFLALSQDGRDKAKQVPFFTAACFKSSPSRRVYGEATHCNLIFLDIDPEKKNHNGKWVETGRYPAKPFVDDPDSLYLALAGYNFAAHLTASSTPEAPRMRIVIDAEKLPLSAYPRAAMTVAALLGLPAVTKESKVSVQPMFLPVMFSDSTEEEHPLIAFALDGRPFAVNDLGEGLFPEFEDKPQPSKDAGLDALEFLRAPVPEINLHTAREALFAIDADCSRSEWLAQAAALKHQFAPHQDDEAIELFDEWSATGQKYGGEAEIKTIWKSLRPTPIGRVPVTIRSLLRKASEAGWDDRKVKEECFGELAHWLDTVTTITELMEQGIRKILAMPLLSAVQEDVLVAMLCKNAKSRFAYPVSVTAIRKDIKRIKDEIKAQEKKPAGKTGEPNWLKGVIYIAATQEFYRHRTGEKFKPEALNASYARHLLPSEDTLQAAGIPITPATLSKPVISPNDYALNDRKIPTVYDYAYDPGQPGEIWFVNRGKRYVNTYIATYPEPDASRATVAGDSLQNHLVNLFAEPEYRRILLDFMAFIVQFPGKKVRWTPFIQGAEGAGKTYLAKVMRAVLGKEHVRTIGDETIKKGWTEWAFGKQLIVLEEIYATGTSRHAVMNLLKGLIANDEMPIEQRNRDSREEENKTNYLLFSNHRDALAITPNDRRYFVLMSRLQHKSQVLALGEDYFRELFGTLEKYPGAMRSFLADWEISPDFQPDGHAPRTKYVAEMVDASAGDMVAAIRRMLLEGDYPLLQYDICSAKTVLDALHMEEGLTRATPQGVAQVLREEGFKQVGRHMLGGERHYLWMRAGVDESTVVDQATDRLAGNKMHLCMELLYE